VLADFLDQRVEPLHAGCAVSTAQTHIVPHRQ